MHRTMSAALIALCCVTGCTSYYKVTDPTTGRTYYTTELKQKGNGSATLKDSRSGNTVTLQNTEVAKIKKDEYNAGKYAKTEAPAPAAPAAK
jgi:hypothetical protein